MLKTRLDRVILGHNQFFGVDHLSQDKGNEKYKKFGEIENVIGFLRQCDNLGIKNMMMSTHPNAGGIVREMSNDKSLSEWKLYPLVPYINKYVRMANEKGMINMGMEILMKTSLSQKFRIFMAEEVIYLWKMLGKPLLFY